MKIDPIMPIAMSAGVSAKPMGLQKAPEPVKVSAESGTGLGAESQQTQAALKELSEAMEPFNISLKFTKDQDTGTIVIQMVDQKSGDTVQQIPSEASLHVAATICKLQGKIFSRIA